MIRRTAVLVLSLGLVASLLASPASSHQALRTGRYECWLSATGQYSYFDLKIMSGGRYVFLLGTERVGAAGTYVHDGKKIRFKSGFLKKRGYTATHLVASNKTHVIYIYDGDDRLYDCGND